MSTHSNSKPTTLDVRVIAVDGKYIGDDIGGAYITIRDTITDQILASGPTTGDSGPNGSPNGLLWKTLRWGDPLPISSTSSVYTTTLNLTAPTRVSISAFGPLAARASANTITTTTWLYPGKDMTEGNGLLLSLPGLICQITSPPTHYAWPTPPSTVTISANVAMMCGCPIGTKPADKFRPGKPSEQPWLPDDFDVSATITGVPGCPIALKWNVDGDNVPGQFSASLNDVPPPGVYQVTVSAWQKSTGNTGVDFATFIVPSAPAPPTNA